MAYQTPKSMQCNLPKDITLLARLLSLDPEAIPNRTWLQRQAHDISSFPDSLLKPYPLLPRLATTFPCTSNRAILCEAHKLLNPCLIRQIFLEVSAECTKHQTRLEQNIFRSPLISEFLDRLHGVVSLWLAPDVYCEEFHASSSVPQYKWIPSGCEACILASIGGRPGIVSDLRASILGRKKHGHPAAFLLPLLEAWLNRSHIPNSARVDSETLTKEIRRCRRQMQKARRQERRNISEGIIDAPATWSVNRSGDTTLYNEDVHEIEDIRVKDAHDFEGSIIDYYANRLSFLPGDDHVEADHPSSNRSVFFGPGTATFHRTDPAQDVAHAPADQRRSMAYSESLYDVQASCTSLPHFEVPGKSANEHAESYRMLLEMQEGEEEEMVVEEGWRSDLAAEKRRHGGGVELEFQ